MKTLVVGVTPNAQRYANMAVSQLKAHGHEVVALGLRAGESEGVTVMTGTPAVTDLHTISLYLSPARQEAIIDYLLSLKPARIIFNPGTENAAFEAKAKEAGIQAQRGCTLVMLDADKY